MSAHKKPQIDAPELQSGPERTRDTVFTAIMWAVYLYLWAPLVSLFAWLLGFEFAYDVMIRSGGARGLKGILLSYGVFLAIIFTVVMAWSLSNKLRYGKLSRRRSASDTTLSEMAEYFGVDVAAAARLRALKLATIQFDDDERPLIARHDPLWPDPEPESPQWRGSDAANTANNAKQSHP